jgi:uncharacterized protein (TIGR02757 family)
LGATLGTFVDRFPVRERLLADPVQLAHGFERAEDAEVAALVAASLAFGRAAALVAKARAALAPLGPHLAERVSELREGEVPAHLRDWTHRWVRGEDLARLLGGIGSVLRRHGSLGAAFRLGLPACEGRDDLLPAMRSFFEALQPGGDAPDDMGTRYLLSVPDGHAASKRACLFLRWMIRAEDGVDLGLWTDVGAHRLTIPLDTHVARIGAYVGLTDRRTPGWLMAREITRNLARFDAADPTRYDFALAHLGIMGSCPRKRDVKRCASCDLLPACRL